jgi:hypothetical protein
MRRGRAAELAGSRSPDRGESSTALVARISPHERGLIRESSLTHQQRVRGNPIVPVARQSGAPAARGRLLGKRTTGSEQPESCSLLGGRETVGPPRSLPVGGIVEK